MLIVGSHISEVVISGRSGHCRNKSKNSPLPDRDSSVAVAMCAVDFIGVTAMCWAFSLPLPESDDDFARHVRWPGFPFELGCRAHWLVHGCRAPAQ
jgi:hypothetical protein